MVTQTKNLCQMTPARSFPVIPPGIDNKGPVGHVGPRNLNPGLKESAPPMKFATTAVLLLASSLTVMSGAVVSPALPGLEAAFAGQAAVAILTRMVLSAPALGVLLCGPWVGGLVDRLGRRQMLIAGFVLYGLGGTSGLYLPSLPALLAGRLVLGVGVAAVMTAATTLIADLTTGRERNRFLGIQAAFMGLGGLVFLTVGGWLADLGWRWPFGVYAVSFLLVPAAWSVLEKDPPAAPADRALDSPPAKVRHLYLAAFLGFALFFLLPVQLPFLLDRKLAASGSQIGLTLGLMTVLAAASSLAFSRLQPRLGSPGVLALTFGGMAPGLALLGLASSWPMTMLGAVVFGVGIGLLTPNLNTWTARLVSARQRGRALGNLNTATFLGQFLSPLIAAPILRAGVSLEHVFVWGGATAGLIALATAVFLGRLLEEGRH
jgi:MFS family permease